MQDTDAASVEGLSGEKAQALADWQRMHRLLLEAEKELAQASRLYAMGRASAAEVHGVSDRVIALRELSLAVLARLRST
jgi:C4-dicarboxylate-specific signal transduction histidine kinase